MVKNPVRLVLTDLDETLLDSDKNLPKANVDALMACREKGILTGFATARSKVPAEAYAKVLEPNVQILNSGGLIMMDDQVIYEKMIPKETVCQIVDLLKDNPAILDICIETREGYFCNQRDPFKYGPAYSHSRYCDFVEPFLLDAYKFTVYVLDEEVFFDITGRFPECKSFSYTQEGWCCIQPIGISKCSGAMQVCSKLGITMSEVMAFGDDITDLEMLRDVGVGVAMANAIPKVSEAAEYHTLSNNEFGVAKFIKDYLED